MRAKTVTLDCDPLLARQLAAAVQAYAHAAYPPGGSECGQVAREALLDTAARCQAHRGGALVLRRRMLPQLRAAVRWCVSQDGPPDIQFPPGLESILTTDRQNI